MRATLFYIQLGNGDNDMKRTRTIGLAAALLSAILLVGCGDTWRGVKQDTGDNLEATGEAIEKAGEKVKD